MFDAAEGADAAGGLFGVEADHVDGGIEVLGLHGRLEVGLVSAIADDDFDSHRGRAGFAAVEAGDFVALFGQEPDEAGGDVAGAADDADSHGMGS